MNMSYIAREVSEDQLRAKGFAIKPDKFGTTALAMIASANAPKEKRSAGVRNAMTLQSNHDKWTLKNATITQARMIDVTGCGSTIVFFAVIEGVSQWESVGGRGLWALTSKEYELRQAVASNLTIKECPSMAQSFIQEIENPVMEVPERGSFSNGMRMMFGNLDESIRDAAKVVLSPLGHCFTVSFPLSTIPAN